MLGFVEPLKTLERGRYVLSTYEDIVTNVKSPTLVLAGPGAGKTHLLGDRTKRLLEGAHEKDPEKHITVVTFGRDASQHMRAKLLDKVSGFSIPPGKLPHIYTYHSLGFDIVKEKPRKVGLLKSARVQADEGIKRLLFRDAAMMLGHSEAVSTKALECKQHGDCKEGSKPPECDICVKYRNIMSTCNCIDYDDQILLACHILETEPDILKKYQRQARHLLVDEYQDINAAQFRLISMLSDQARNGLFAVGDDAQAIYSFRGADTRFILDFGEDFPEAFIPPLQHSWRCHQNTMNEAARVLQSFYPEWTGPYDLEYHVTKGEGSYIWQHASEAVEAEWVARITRESIDDKKSVMVLAPKRSLFPKISKALLKYKIAHFTPVSPLGDSTNDKLVILLRILTWLRNPADNFAARVAAEELLNHGRARVAGYKKDSHCTEETIAKREVVERDIARIWEKVKRKSAFWQSLESSKTLSEPVRELRDCMSALLHAYNSGGGDSAVFAKELLASTGLWKNTERLLEDLCSIISALNEPNPPGFGGVQLMTMRKAKGLEADVVIMVGLEDDIIPGGNTDLAESARLFYVSMTRAKERLYLFHSSRRPRNVSFGPNITGKKRSRFLEAIGKTSSYKAR